MTGWGHSGIATRSDLPFIALSMSFHAISSSGERMRLAVAGSCRRATQEEVASEARKSGFSLSQSFTVSVTLGRMASIARAGVFS